MDEIISKLTAVISDSNLLINAANDMKNADNFILKHLNKSALKADAVIKITEMETLLSDVKNLLS